MKYPKFVVSDSGSRRALQYGWALMMQNILQILWTWDKEAVEGNYTVFSNTVCSRAVYPLFSFFLPCQSHADFPHHRRPAAEIPSRE